ncbi:MAG: hypothetical protein ACI9UQ_000553, partial [Candidatus Krumholzibacteriia bacterium]
FALDQFHHQKTVTVILVESINGRHVRVLQFGESGCFAFESGHALGVVRECSGENLYGNLAFEGGVTRSINLAHAAFAEQADDFVMAESFSYQNLRTPMFL